MDDYFISVTYKGNTVITYRDTRKQARNAVEQIAARLTNEAGEGRTADGLEFKRMALDTAGSFAYHTECKVARFDMGLIGHGVIEKLPELEPIADESKWAWLRRILVRDTAYFCAAAVLILGAYGIYAALTGGL